MSNERSSDMNSSGDFCPCPIEYIEEGYVCMMTPNILKNIVLTLNLEYDEFLIRKKI